MTKKKTQQQVSKKTRKQIARPLPFSDLSKSLLLSSGVNAIGRIAASALTGSFNTIDLEIFSPTIRNSFTLKMRGLSITVKPEPTPTKDERITQL